MSIPEAGDRIERWLLLRDSTFSRQMGRTEHWDPDELFAAEMEVLGDEFDLEDAFHRYIGTHYADYLVVDEGRRVSARYEMIACLPTRDSDGHVTYRVLMHEATSTGSQADVTRLTP